MKSKQYISQGGNQVAVIEAYPLRLLSLFEWYTENRSSLTTDERSHYLSILETMATMLGHQELDLTTANDLSAFKLKDYIGSGPHAAM